MIKSMYFLVLFILLLCISCNNKIKKFEPDQFGQIHKNYKQVFNKKAIIPLRNEWNELYLFLKKGHIQQSINAGNGNHIYSYQFYRFLSDNLLRLYDTPFLQDYSQFVLSLGKPDYEKRNNGRIFIAYSISVVDDPCSTCTHNAFTFEFDEKTNALLRE